MGRTTAVVVITNLAEAYLANRGQMPADAVRTVTVADALIDTGATSLALPKSLIDRLGLHPRATRTVRTALGIRTATVYDAVRIEIMGRDCSVDPVEVPEETGVLVGQVPLELLDFVVDPRGQRLIGNPAHDGQHVLDLL